MTALPPLVSLPPLNVISTQSGEIVTPFSLGPIPERTVNLVDFVQPNEQEAFKAALHTDSVAQRFIHFLQPGTPFPQYIKYTVAFQPSRIGSHLSILAHAIPEAASPHHDPRDLHTLKGLVAQLEGMESSPSATMLKTLRSDAFRSIQEHGITLSPGVRRGPTPRRTRPFNPSAWIQKLQATYEAQVSVSDKHITFKPIRAPTLPLYLLGDIESLDMIVDNLITNAIKYNREGGSIQVVVHLDPDPSDPENMILTIDVVDTGPGITPIDRPKVFALGERLGREGGSVEGQGVGLCTSKERADTLDWELSFHSNEESPGTTFTLKATFKKPPARSPSGAAGAASAGLTRETALIPIPRRVKPRNEIVVLVIDDDRVFRLIIPRMLEAKGISSSNIIVVSSYEEAQQKIEKTAIDIIICDDQIWDGKSGKELIKARRVAEQRNGMPPIPCILFSGDSITESDCHTCGGTKAFQKPYTPMIIDSILKEYFQDPPQED